MSVLTRVMGSAAISLLLAGLTLGVSAAQSLNAAQSDYVEHCGGCHGIQGNAFPAHVPPLRDTIGYFLCTETSRKYLLQLPNVALATLSDDKLAAVMNFVVFDLGGASADRAAPRFTEAEISRERKQPLTGASLSHVRTSIVRQIRQHCAVPPGALHF